MVQAGKLSHLASLVINGRGQKQCRNTEIFTGDRTYFILNISRERSQIGEFSKQTFKTEKCIFRKERACVRAASTGAPKRNARRPKSA